MQGIDELPVISIVHNRRIIIEYLRSFFFGSLRFKINLIITRIYIIGGTGNKIVVFVPFSARILGPPGKDIKPLLHVTSNYLILYLHTKATW